MKACDFLIAGCILLLLELSVTNGQDEEGCPYNEEEVDCVSGCMTCAFANKTCPPTDECEEGCDCKAGYLRNKFGYCIPRRYCGASNEEPPTEDGREVANSGGCPNSQICIVSCIRRGFRTGLCLGPGHRYCNCFSTSPVPAGQETTGNSEVANSGGCPNTQRCILSCRRRHFETGECLGPRRGYCNCYSGNTRNHGCPVRSLCEAFCKSQRYSTGKCLGDRRIDCICSGKLD